MTTRIVECYPSSDAAIHGPSCDERTFQGVKATSEARAYAAEQTKRGYWTALFDSDLELIEETAPAGEQA